MGAGEDEEGWGPIRRLLCRILSAFLFPARGHGLPVYRDSRVLGRNRVAWYIWRTPDELDRQPSLLSHSFEAADWLVSFPARNFLYIGPELAAG